MGQFEELDIKRLIKIVIQNLKLVIISALLVGIMAFVYTKTMILPTYKSSIMMYVNNNNRATMLSKSQTSGSDLEASQKLVQTYITFIKSDTVMNEVSSELERRYGLEYSAKAILGMISATQVNETEIFKLNITSINPEHTALIANAIADVAPDVIDDYIEASSIKVVDNAIEGELVGPNVVNNMLLGIVIGLLFSCAFIILRECFDTRVKSEDDLERWFHKSILGIIPEIGSPDYTNSKYDYYRKNRKFGSYYGKYKNGGESYGKQQYAEFIKASEDVTNVASQKD